MPLLSLLFTVFATSYLWLVINFVPPTITHFSPPPLCVDFDFGWHSLYLDWPLVAPLSLQLATFVLRVITLSLASRPLVLDPLLLLMHEGLFLL